MPRTKSLNIVVTYGDSGFAVNDLGPDKHPRFELYHTSSKKPIKKSDDPTDFDEYVIKTWHKGVAINDI